MDCDKEIRKKVSTILGTYLQTAYLSFSTSPTA